MRTPVLPRAAASILIAALGLACVLGIATARAQDDTRTFTVTARKHAFEPASIEVRHNDLVKITLRTADVAHSFTVDDYRIAKRASADHPVTFEFRADKVGTFPFYCNLKSDAGCRQMRGVLVVKAR